MPFALCMLVCFAGHCQSIMAFQWAASLTFSRSTESHVGTTVHGVRAKRGYSLDELKRVSSLAQEAGCPAHLYELQSHCGVDKRAYVLHLEQALTLLSSAMFEDVQKEYLREIWPRLDRHLVMFRKLMKKNARGNAELGPFDVESNFTDYPEGQKLPEDAKITGRVIAFHRVPLHHEIAQSWSRLLGTGPLLAEVNHYGPSMTEQGEPDSQPAHRFCKNGIGFHGDSERPDVACLCIGTEKKELHFQAFKATMPVGHRFQLTLCPGDAYIMCQAACGHNWHVERRSPRVVHYRHAAGAPGTTYHTKSMEQLLRARNQKQDKRDQKHLEPMKVRPRC